jgi:peptidoglycan hydrolase-like protein with peptidoglycan-binding domain
MTRPTSARWAAVAAALALLVVACADDPAARDRDAGATSAPRSASSSTSSTTIAPTTSAPPTTTPTTLPPPPLPEVLRRGAEGPAVQLVQRRLEELGFRPGAVDGRYGDATFSAVMAFQKFEGLDPDGHAGPITLTALGAGLTKPGARLGRAPRIEVDLARQVAFVIAAGGTTKIINVSSGNDESYARPQGGTGVARTPRGSFEVERRINGVRVAPLGKMYRPMYFKGGFAVHGSSNVPGYPASHGCVRTTNVDQDFVFDTLPDGAAVEIYGD